MEFPLSRHAVDQASWRNITHADIERVLSAPTWSPATTRGTRYDGIVDGERLAVVVVDGSDPLLVITAFWTDLPDGKRPVR